MGKEPPDDTLGAIAAYERDHDHEHQITPAECRHPECEEQASDSGGARATGSRRYGGWIGEQY